MGLLTVKHSLDRLWTLESFGHFQTQPPHKKSFYTGTIRLQGLYITLLASIKCHISSYFWEKMMGIREVFQMCIICLFYKFIYLFIYFWLRWIFVAAHGLSLVVVSRGYSSLWCMSFSLRWLLLLKSTGSRHAGFSSCGLRASVVVARGLWSSGSEVVAQGLSCSMACEIFPDQGSKPCPLHWQADS